MLKLNIVNKIPDEFIPIIKEKYQNYLKSCFKKNKKTTRKKKLKKGRLKTFRRRR